METDSTDDPPANMKSKTAFQCDVCNRSFSRSNCLNEHKNIHQNIKPFNCIECGKSFRQSSNYYRHRQLHTQTSQFECTICKRTFKRDCYLKSHLVSHNNIKTKMCHKCGNTFKHQGDLTRHLKIHDNKKEYKCDICHVGFNDGSSMRRHKKKIHAKDKDDNLFDQMDLLHQHSNLKKSLKKKKNCSINTQNDWNEKSSDLTNPTYLNWVIDYVSVCRILPQPLPTNIFHKIIDLHKDIAIHLSKNHNDNPILKNAFDDLHTIITEQLFAKKS